MKELFHHWQITAPVCVRARLYEEAVGRGNAHSFEQRRIEVGFTLIGLTRGKLVNSQSKEF